MKRLTLILILIGCLLVSGCAADPAYVEVLDETPVDVDIAEVSYDDSFDVNVTNDTLDVKVVDDGGDIITIDEATGALATIEYEHYEIHHGHTFTVMEVTDLGNGAVRDILVVSPNTTKWAHLVWEIEHELETMIQFYQNTTYTDNGTAIISFNRHGNSINEATTLVYHTPTITNVGTLVGTIQQGDGKKAGGSDREANEFILKQNYAYLIRITNLTVNNNLIFMKLNWYEHIDGE